MQPIGPRFITISAWLAARMAVSAVRASVLPPAMWISSSVPTIRSQAGSTAWSCSVTRADDTKRCSPRPGAVKPHSTGR